MDKFKGFLRCSKCESVYLVKDPIEFKVADDGTTWLFNVRDGHSVQDTLIINNNWPCCDCFRDKYSLGPKEKRFIKSTKSNLVSPKYLEILTEDSVKLLDSLFNTKIS